MSFIKSPLTYPGAKSWAINQILPLVPRFEEYRECFLGGSSVYLSIKQTYPENKKYWVNDLYITLYNFYIQVQQNPDAVINQVMVWKNDFQDKGRQLQQFLKINAYSFNDIQKAAAYFTWNLTSFSGFGGFSESNFNKKFNDDRIGRLTEISKLLQGTKITNLDYSKLINAQPSDGIDDDNVFLFLDPPYYNVVSTELYGKKGDLHRYFDHYRFAKTMKDNRYKYKWLITYDDSNTVRRLFESWATIIPYEFTYTSRRVKTGHELFISNYLDELPKDKQKTIDNSWF